MAASASHPFSWVMPISTGRSVSIISAIHAAQVPSRAASLDGCGPERLANNGAAEHFVQRCAALGRVWMLLMGQPREQWREKLRL